MTAKRRTRKRRNKPGAGRPPSGLQAGEKVSEYPRLTVRVPADVRDELKTAARALEVQEWRVLVGAIRAYVGTGSSLSAPQQRLVRDALSGRQR